MDTNIWDAFITAADIAAPPPGKQKQWRMKQMYHGPSGWPELDAYLKLLEETEEGYMPPTPSKEMSDVPWRPVCWAAWWEAVASARHAGSPLKPAHRRAVGMPPDDGDW